MKTSVADIVNRNIDFTENKPLKHSIYDALRKTIILGEIPAGERIVEKELSEEMNISRTPIRYALQRLKKEQLVKHIPRVGFIVSGISIKDAYEIYDIRKALDVLATTKAMTLMTEEDFLQLELHLEEAEKLNEADKVDELLKNFSDFNKFIYEKSRMPRLQVFLTGLNEYLVYFRDMSIRAKERRGLALREHWIIYESMKNQDEDHLRKITNKHLDHSLSFIIKEMKRRGIPYEFKEQV